MDNLESVYDEKLAPLIQKIIDTCEEEGMPMFMEFQYSDEGFCRSATTYDQSHCVFDHYCALSECIDDEGTNIDKYMFWVAKNAKRFGHSSLFLHAAGIPEEDAVRR